MDLNTTPLLSIALMVVPTLVMFLLIVYFPALAMRGIMKGAARSGKRFAWRGAMVAALLPQLLTWLAVETGLFAADDGLRWGLPLYAGGVVLCIPLLMRVFAVGWQKAAGLALVSLAFQIVVLWLLYPFLGKLFPVNFMLHVFLLILLLPLTWIRRRGEARLAN